MKTFLKSFLRISLLLSLLVGVTGNIVSADFKDDLEAVGGKTELQNYETTTHADASTREGAKNITSAIFFVVDFMKYVLGAIAVLMTIINAVQMITAGKDAEDQLTKQKSFMKYSIMGLIVVFVADEAIKSAFFGQEGEFLRDEEAAIESATAGGNIIEGMYMAVEVFLGSIAVLMLVYSGIQILAGAASEETVNSAKKRIYLSAIGLVVVGLSETIVKDFLFKNQGQEIDVARGQAILASLTNFLVSAIGTISVLVFVYAGFLYILNFGNEESTGKAKKMMMGALIGIAVSGIAFAAVSTLVQVQGAQ
ncbi:MAG: hypothetical protein ACD_28C00349G0002 [uncultured bacterium]|nr:MAG: hypothetical protein ACD_28C00349G0002 [uncultured bacterium]KKT74507.1 MAG: hypothetical protein UW70_C0052G0002 [Candidatus Peregrinibacteria bacterium GW2011_GWA2_44_7]